MFFVVVVCVWLSGCAVVFVFVVWLWGNVVVAVLPRADNGQNPALTESLNHFLEFKFIFLLAS